jgi:hypothetical protein
MIERKAATKIEHEQAKEEPAPAATSPGLLGIQRRAGNAATLAMLGAQAKLQVGAANDPAEREADAIARQVVASLSSGGSSAAATKAPSGIARAIHRRATPGAAPIGPEGGEVDASTEQALNSAGSGAALAEPVRRKMETAFGADFSGVRVHTGSSAESLNRSLGAEAFTTGSDIFFRSGMPDASSSSGQELLAHELAHTVQQGAAPVARQVLQRKEEEEELEEEAGEDAGGTAEGAGLFSEEGAQAAGEEQEAGESEEQQEQEGTIVTGSLPAPQAAQPAIGPPPGIRADSAGRPAGRSPHKADTAPRKPSGGVRVVAGDVGVSTSTSRNDGLTGAAAQEDGVSASPKVTTSTSGGLATEAFGAMQPDLGIKNIKYQAKTGFFKGNYVKISFELYGNAQWGVDGDGNIDVPSGNSDVITAENYEEIVSDLTPELQEKSWRAPRNKYWSEAICARHEKYHANDFQTWLKSQGRALVVNELQNSTVDLDETTRLEQATIETEAFKLVQAAYVKLDNAYDAYMQGDPVATYLSMPAEKRAFGDGKKPYLALAAAVKKTGKKLAKEAESAAT